MKNNSQPEPTEIFESVMEPNLELGIPRPMIMVTASNLSDVNHYQVLAQDSKLHQ